MRGFLVVLIASLLCVSSVSAVSMLRPDALKTSSISLSVGDDRQFVIPLRNDGDARDITFFANASDGIVSLNGQSSESLTESFQPYQVINFTLTVDAVKSGTSTLVYGFKYGGGGSGVGLQQVVQERVKIVVNGDSGGVTPVVYPPSTYSSGGGGGGGGGGVVPGSSNASVPSPKPVVPVVPSVVSNVSKSGSSGAGIGQYANASSVAGRDIPVVPAVSSVGRIGGSSLLLVIIFTLGVAMCLEVGMYAVVKKGDS